MALPLAPGLAVMVLPQEPYKTWLAMTQFY